MISLLLHNIRSAHNVGSLIRSADGFGIDEIIFSGYTPYPRINNDKRLPHIIERQTKLIHKTALGAELSQKLVRIDDAYQLIDTYKQQDYTVIALEQDINSVPLSGYSAPAKALLILGEEVDGITNELLSKCDVIVEIPMKGRKESFNVSVAGGIAMYALTAEA